MPSLVSSCSGSWFLITFGSAGTVSRRIVVAVWRLLFTVHVYFPPSVGLIVLKTRLFSIWVGAPGLLVCSGTSFLYHDIWSFGRQGVAHSSTNGWPSLAVKVIGERSGDSISNLGDGEGSFDDGLLPPIDCGTGGGGGGGGAGPGGEERGKVYGG